jgi:hypothetical protein
MRTAKEICLAIVDEPMFTIYVNDQVSKIKALAKAASDGECAYLLAEADRLRKKLSSGCGWLSKTFVNSGFNTELFNDPSNATRVFEYADDIPQDDYGYEEKYNEKIFRGFLPDYCVYRCIMAAVNSSPTIQTDGEIDKRFKILFEALKTVRLNKDETGCIRGRECVFLDLMGKKDHEPKMKLTWRLKAHKNKALSIQSLVDFLTVVGFTRKEIENLAPKYFDGVKIYTKHFQKTESEYHKAIETLVRDTLK